MGRVVGWVLVFALGVWLGSWSARVRAVAPARVTVRQGLARQEAAVQAARRQFEAAPESCATAHRLALALLTLREWQQATADAGDLAQSPAPLEAELRHLAELTATLAQTPSEHEQAAKLRRRIEAESEP